MCVTFLIVLQVAVVVSTRLVTIICSSALKVPARHSIAYYLGLLIFIFDTLKVYSLRTNNTLNFILHSYEDL